MAEYKIDKKIALAILEPDKSMKVRRVRLGAAREVIVGQVKRVSLDDSLGSDQFIIDLIKESPDNKGMEGRYYSNKEIEEIKAAVRAEAWKEATLAGLSAQSGIPIAELEAKWDSGQFDGSEAKALRAQWRQTIESYAKRSGVDPKDLRGQIVSKEEFKKNFG